MFESPADRPDNPNGSIDHALEQIRAAKLSPDDRVMFASVQAIVDGCRSIQTQLELYLFRKSVLPSEISDVAYLLLEVHEGYMHLIGSTIDQDRIRTNHQLLRGRFISPEMCTDSRAIIDQGILKLAEQLH